ncbi:MAG: alpha/beta hydrolase [Lachnospiraceae bacterium]|nr:alpha/beta hydrolase [Lachnospiraceae bacterium]
MSYFDLSNGEKIYYEDTKAGDRTILMIHGWTSSSEEFKAVVPAIAEKARCITLDLRGHGRSKDANKDKVTLDTLASDVNELIRALKLENITLLGWSMGAAVVMKYADKYGCSALKNVILCDMTPKQINENGWRLGLYKGAYSRADMEADEGRDFFTLYKKFVIGAIPRLGRIPGFLLNGPLKKELAKGDEGVLRSLSQCMKSEDYRGCVDKFTVPVFYFYANPGSLFSPELADWYGEKVNTSYLAVAINESTHMMVRDQPEQFAEEVIKILEDIEY